MQGQPQMQTPKTLQEIISFSEKEVSSLLEMYSKYKKISEDILNGIGGAKKTFSLLIPVKSYTNFDQHSEQKVELENIGNAMKFQNPLIWANYKFEAYQNDLIKRLTSVNDLVEHCKVDGICTKRFDFINKWMRKNNNGLDIKSTELFTSDSSIAKMAKNPIFQKMLLDVAFMKEWEKNENDISGKWKNYAISEPDHDCEIACTC